MHLAHRGLVAIPKCTDTKRDDDTEQGEQCDGEHICMLMMLCATIVPCVIEVVYHGKLCSEKWLRIRASQEL